MVLQLEIYDILPASYFGHAIYLHKGALLLDPSDIYTNENREDIVEKTFLPERNVKISHLHNASSMCERIFQLIPFVENPRANTSVK